MEQRIEVIDSTSVPTTPQRWQEKGADSMLERLLVISYLLIITPLYYVPWIGIPLYFCFCCWLYSFYCFGYKWALRHSNWDLDSRLSYFEFHWIYFLGFGTPFTLALWKFDLVVGLGFYAVLFPIFVAMAQVSHPLRPISTNVVLPHQIAIFHESTWLSHKFLDFFLKRRQSSQ